MTISGLTWDIYMSTIIREKLLMIPVATNSDTLVSSVSIQTDDVVEFIWHSSRSRHISNTEHTFPATTVLSHIPYMPHISGKIYEQILIKKYAGRLMRGSCMTRQAIQDLTSLLPFRWPTGQLCRRMQLIALWRVDDTCCRPCSR